MSARSICRTSVGASLGAVFALTAACGKFGGDASIAEAGKEHWRTIDQYCTECHNEIEFVADLSFERMGPDQIAEHAETFENAIRKLRGGLMPPPGGPRPSEEEATGLIAWLERALDAAGADRQWFVSIPPHRLNRKEYTNAVRDLLSLEVDGSALLPQDEIVEHFDNIAGGLQVSPSFIEQYVSAARRVAVQAVGSPDARPGSQTHRAGNVNQSRHVRGLPLGTRGGMLVEHFFPADGEYVVNVADMATHIWGNDMEFENNVVVLLDNKLVYETVIGGEEDMRAYDQIQNGVMEQINARLKNIRFTATAGPHNVGVTFRRRTFAESDDQLRSFVPGGGQDRIYTVSSVEISGPFNAQGLSPTPSRERIFTCHPDDDANPDLCAAQIITEIGTRAYRRPLEEADLTELLAYYREGAEIGGFEEGIRRALTGILASPYFLYRVEEVPEGVVAGNAYSVNDLTLASKLSFFLWNTIPDDELLELAVRGELGETETLRRQIRRMLEDPRSETLASNFMHQWLDMRRLDEVEPDRVIFPYASGAGDPRGDYLTELTLFAKSIFDEDRSVRDLMTARHSYLNERVALLYGITTVKGGGRFQRVELEDSARWGLLGKGAVLMAAAYPNRTSPVLRGAFVLEHLGGTPPGLPPPDVEAFPENEIGTGQKRTVREILAQHRESPACSGCHNVMDPLGFALENFDAVGTWRDKDRFTGTPIDSQAELPDGTTVSGPDDLREALMRRPDQFVQTFTEGLLKYALGRTLDYRDMPAVRKIVREAAKDDYRFSSLVWQVVTSEPFQMRRAPQTNDAIVAVNAPAQ